MTARSLILVVAAFLIAGGTAYFARHWLTAERAQISAPVPAPAPDPAHSVLVAKADLPAGLFIQKEHLRWQAWPDDTLDPNYIVEGQQDIGALVGAVVRRGIVAGQPITDSMVARPGDRGFLAAVLKPGMRAISISISDTTGISGLVFPGDRVDILLTHAVSKGGNEGEQESRVSETILENVRILAIGQTLNDQNGEPNRAGTATIELTPKQVEMIAVAADLGRLSLSLRSLGKPELMAGGTVLAATDAGATDATAPAKDPVAAIREIAEPERGRTYTRDSEVSRVIGPSGGHKVMVFNGGTLTEVSVQ